MPEVGMSLPSLSGLGHVPAAVVLIGAGGHARVVAEALAAQSVVLAGHIAPQADETGMLAVYLGDDSVLAAMAAQGFGFALGLGFVDAAGAVRRRALLAQLHALSAQLVSVVHPAAILSPSVTLGEGCFVAAGAIVGTRSRIGRGAIINSGAIVDHDGEIGENCHIATGARLAGGLRLGRDVLIGAGAVLRQGLAVGDGAVVGAGAVVLRPVAAGTQVIGNPARVRPLLQPQPSEANASA